jgi:hypothetical protein
MKLNYLHSILLASILVGSWGCRVEVDDDNSSDEDSDSDVFDDDQDDGDSASLSDDKSGKLTSLSYFIPGSHAVELTGACNTKENRIQLILMPNYTYKLMAVNGQYVGSEESGDFKIRKNSLIATEDNWSDDEVMTCAANNPKGSARTLTCNMNNDNSFEFFTGCRSIVFTKS